MEPSVLKKWQNCLGCRESPDFTDKSWYDKVGGREIAVS